MRAPVILLLRHAPAPGNLEGRYLGSTDEDLSPEGEALARRCAGGLGEVPRLVWASPMKRCLSTARLLCPGAEILPLPGLRESDFGAFEGKNYEELRDDPAYRAWVESGGRTPPPGGEGSAAGAARAAAAFREIVRELLASGEGRCAVVTHGGVIMALCAAFALPERDFYAWQSPCCGGWLLALEPGLWEKEGKLRVLGPVRPKEERK